MTDVLPLVSTLLPLVRQYSCTICISSVGHIQGNGVVFVTGAPTKKELNTNSQELEWN